MRYGALIAGAMLWAGTSALAESLIVHLPGVEVTRIRVSFACGAEGVALGLPAGPFTVEYLNAGDNHLAMLPVHGKRLIFAIEIGRSS